MGQDASGLRPLVPPPAGDWLEMQRRGLEMVAAANRLALSWLGAAAAQHAAQTRRALEEMAETARRLAGAEAPPDAAREAVEALDRAGAMGLQTAREIAGLMTSLQEETARLLAERLSAR